MRRDLGYGRGWLNTAAAASIARVDAELGRPLQITEAGRTWAQQDAHYQRYRRYLAGGPWAPIALPPGRSLHESGLAIDTDEHARAGMVARLNRHGWVRTVYRNGRLVEPWHFEYRAHRDQHKNQPTGGGEPLPEPEGDEEEMKPRQIHAKFSDGRVYRALTVPGTGYFVKWTEPNPVYANKIAAGFDTGDSTEVTQSLFGVFEREATAMRPKDALSIELAEA